jgi:hypothetical protein
VAAKPIVASFRSASRLAKPQRGAFDKALDWAQMGTSDDFELPELRIKATKTPPSGAFQERMMGLEPTTFCMASRRSSQLSYIRVGRAF